MNRAVAVAETEGPAVGLALLDSCRGDLDGYHLLHASRGSMLERLGRRSEAAEAYGPRAALARTDAEISFLSMRREELASSDPGSAGNLGPRLVSPRLWSGWPPQKAEP